MNDPKRYKTWIRTVDAMKMALLAVLLAGIYYSAYSLMVKWWQRDDYNYCYLIPLVVLYLIWERRHKFFGQPSASTWKGSFLFVAGIALYWLGELGGEYYTLYLSSWLVLVGLVWLHIGWQKLKVILFPLLFLLTMFPPPNFIYNNLSLKLKLISSQISVAVIHLLGMTAFREGNVIDLGFTQLQVVDACSGLRYLIPLVVLSLLLAYYIKAAWWKRIVLVLSAVPISIFINGLRIVSVALLYPVFGPQVAEGFFHDFSGWLIFMASIGILLLEIWVLGKVGRRSTGKAGRYLVDFSDSRVGGCGEDTPPPPSRGDLPAAENSLKSVLSPAAARSYGFFQPQFIVAVLLLGGTLALSHGIEFREKVPIARSFDYFPMQVAQWSGQREAMEQKIIDELDFSDSIVVNYKSPSGGMVNFYVAYYESQRKGESIHSPETCLPGGGWVFKRTGTATLPLENHNPEKMEVNRAFMQKGGYRQLSYFWFPMRGRILTSLYQLKLYNFWDALTRQRTDGALVRLVTPVGEMEPVEAADERLRGFARGIVPVLDGFLPK